MLKNWRWLLFSALFVVIQNSNLKAQFSGGDGSLATPYIIANFADLVTLSGNSIHWNKHFVQSADIDASSSASLNSGAGFLPIANTTTAFTGSYDGQNYTITGLTINRPTTSSVGLFSELKGATIANIRLSAAVISGNNNVGGFVGWSGQSSQLTNLIIEANAMVTGLDDVGGIVGEAEDTGLTNCHSMATIDGNDTTGGLIGFCDLNLTAKTVLSCSFQGILTGDGDDVGGLIGQNQQSVENCFSVANVTSLDATGDDHYGVLIGLNQGAVSKSYALGTVTASGIEIGGLIGRNESSVSKCYSVVRVTGTNDIGGLIGYNTGQVSYCFALGSVRGNDDTGGLIGNHLTGATLDQCYAAVRVMNTADDEIGGLIAEREGSVTNCFWVDVFGDDYAYLGDEENSVDEQIKQVSNVPHPFVNYSLSQIQGSNAIATLTFFDFVNHWDPAPNGAPGAFPVLKDMPPPAGAPIAPTGFTANGGNNQVNLSWSSNGESDIMSYNIYRSGSANFELSSATLLATVSHTPAGMSYTDDGAGFLPAPVNGTLYHYALTALDNDANESLAHYGAAIPGEYTASVQLSLEIDGVTYTENHGNISPDAYAVYTNTSGGNITSYHTSIVDGSGNDQGLLHPTTATSGTLTVTPVGLQPGQQWYLFYDDNTVSGYPVRNTSGEPGSGTTLVTGTGNNPITLEIGIDGIVTDYLFYVDKPVFNNTAPTVLDLTDVTVNLYPQRLDMDVLVTDDEMSANNDGVGNYSGLSLTVQRLGGANMNDVFGLSVPNENFTYQDGVIYYYGKSVGAYIISPGSIQIQLTGVEIIITQNVVNNIVRGITYAHSTSASMPAQLTLEWTVSDGLADVSLNQEVSLGYYSGGNGTQYNPWQISTLEDLADLSQHQAHWADYFVLTDNIDASGAAFFDDLDDNADGNKYNDPDDASASGMNQGFSPIGTSSIPFSGSFSGQGFTIAGLFISRATNNNTGLFGFVDGATIEGLQLSNVQISGADATGALAGCAINAELSAILVSGNIIGTSMTGGLIGKAENTLVSQCIANGSVMGADDCGGLIGRFIDNHTVPIQQVSNSYATASVVGQNNVGGLIGNNQTGVVHCYSIGSVTGVTLVGGLIGLGNTGFATASFWNTETAGVSANGFGTPATTDPMLSYCTYFQAGWDLVGETDNGADNIWSMNTSHHNGYPTLSWEGYTNTGTCAAKPFVINISPSPGTTALEFQVLTDTGPVNYYWESSPSGKAGAGSFSSTMLGLVSIPDLPEIAGESITLFIEPTFLRQLSLYNTNTNDFDIDLQQWGDVAWSSMAYAFADCINLSISATDSPDLSNVSSLAYVFFQATSFNEALNHWDVSNVVDFQGMFQGASAFNQPLNDWDVSSATNMSFMFAESAAFDQNLTLWDITGVTTMEAMFKAASVYNEPLGDWTLRTGVVLTDFLNDSGLDCINYAKTLKGWVENENTPTGLSLSAENIAYGISALEARTSLINNLDWTISGDTPTAGDCPLCPVLTDIPDDVVIINSSCTENCAPTGGSIAAPAIPCQTGYFHQYQVNAGIWSDTLPIYQQSGPAQTIKTRCVCEEDFTSIGPESAGVTTEPGLCVLPVASISGDTIICANDSTTLIADGGSAYVWSSGSTNNQIIVSPDADTTYSLIAISAAGCRDTASVHVLVRSLPSVEISGLQTICAGESTTLTASSGESYQWSTGAVSSSIEVAPASSTSYHVTVTDIHGCSDASSVTVSVISLPVPVISGETTVCLGDSTSLMSSGGVQYFWSTGSMDSIIRVSPLVDTDYTVVVSNLSGCRDSATVRVMVNLPPVAVISGATSICAGGSTTLSANPGLSYLWSTLETNSAITVSPDEDTNYQLIVTDTNGCMDTATTTVMVLPLPTIVCPDNVIIASSNDGLADCIGSASWVHPVENAGACGPISLTMQLNGDMAMSVIPGEEITQALAVGVHQLTYTVTDSGLNQATCQMEILVLDDEAPIMNCQPTVEVVLNGQSTTPLVPDQLAVVVDNCGSPMVMTIPSAINIAQLGQAIPVNIVAYDEAGNSANCVTVVQVSGLPEGWRHNNGSVGNCNSEAMFNPVNSVWTANAQNCVYTSPFENDYMMFAQRQLCGDGSITAQINSMGGAPGWAGIAMRETNAIGAKKIHMLINLSSSVLQREVRTSTGAQAVPQYMSNPQNRTWLRIVRHGNQFTGYSSHDGLTWWFVLRVSIPMNACIEIGLNLINRYPNQLTNASYANVSVTGSASPPGIVINDYAESIDMPQAIAFEVFPNPSGGMVNIQLDNHTVSGGSLKVYNQLGICVFQRTLDNHFEQLAMSHLPDGIYWVQYNHDHYVSGLKRIILQKNR
jgi:surface protein